jgi:hypothetical protein
MRRLIKLPRPGLWAALIALPVLLLAACGESADQQEIENAVRDTGNNWNDRNVDAFVARWTDQGLIQEFGQDGETQNVQEIRDSLGQFMGDPPINIREVSDVEVSDQTATAEVEYALGKAVSLEEWSLVEDGGMWKIDATETLTPPVPSGATAIDLEMNEFAFIFDRDNIDQQVAFEVRNTGDQPHEIALLKTDVPLSDLLAMPPTEEPPGEFVGFVDPLDPGQETNMVFDGDLESGRYVVACFLPDTDDPQMTPHALKGMITEFNVE